MSGSNITFATYSQRTRSPEELKKPLLPRSWAKRLRLPWKAACPAQEQMWFAWRMRVAMPLGKALLPSQCRHLRWVFRNLPPSSSTQLALSLMGDACKVLCRVIAALFFKQIAAFSARYAAGEESRCCCIPTRASLSRSCRGRDSQPMKSPQGSGPFQACKPFRESCLFLFSFSVSSVNNT